MMDTLVQRQATRPELQEEIEARGQGIQGEARELCFISFLVFFFFLKTVQSQAVWSSFS